METKLLNINLEKIETSVYDDMLKYRHFILKYAKLFEINEKILSSVIFVEKIQYSLPNLLSKLHKLKFGLCDIRVFNSFFYGWLNCSAGYTHVLAPTVRSTYYKLNEMKSPFAKYINENDEFKVTNIEDCIRISAAILRCLQEWWSSEIDISNNPAILGTVYNITDRYQHPKPHKNPVAGGSDMDIIIDGRLYKDKIDFPHLNFGTRTLLAYNSQSMANFLRG